MQRNMMDELHVIESSKTTSPTGPPIQHKRLEEDPVTQPEHYTRGKLETIDAIMGLSLDPAEGNVVKYICRHRLKGGVNDLEKAMEYVKLMIKNYDDWYK